MNQTLEKDLLSKLGYRQVHCGREAKTRILDELCEDYDSERKYAIKLLRDSLLAPSG